MTRNQNLILLVVISIGGCAVEPMDLAVNHPASLSFEEFERTVYREPESGLYIVNGDIPISSRAKLQSFHAVFARTGALIVHNASGVDARWSDVSAVFFSNRMGRGA